MVGIYRLSTSSLRCCLILVLLSLCSAVMSFRGPPRPGVSHAPAAEINPLRSWHANWPGVRVLGEAPKTARHEPPQYPPLVGQVKATTSGSGGATHQPRLRGLFCVGSAAKLHAGRQAQHHVREHRVGVDL